MTSLLDTNVNLQLNTFLQMPNCYVYWKDVDGIFLGCNETAASSVDLTSPTELVGQTDFDLPIRKMDANVFRKNDLLVLKEKQAVRLREFAIKKNVKTTYSTIKMPLYDDVKEIIGVLGVAWITHEQDTSASPLTSRQEECLGYLARGMTMKEIAYATSLSIRTVEHYLEKVKKKLRCNSRSDLIKKALRMPAIKNQMFAQVQK